MSAGVLNQPCESCEGDHWTRDHDDHVAVERAYDSADLPGCRWCRECGSCDYGLAMSCTCGDCDCTAPCGHPRCQREGSER